MSALVRHMALLASLLTGTAHHPGSFTHGAAFLASARRSAASTSRSRAAPITSRTRCSSTSSATAATGLSRSTSGRVVVVARFADGSEAPLVPYDPIRRSSQRGSPAAPHGREAIAYPTPREGAQICAELSAITSPAIARAARRPGAAPDPDARSAPPQWLCFAAASAGPTPAPGDDAPALPPRRVQRYHRRPRRRRPGGGAMSRALLCLVLGAASLARVEPAHAGSDCGGSGGGGSGGGGSSGGGSGGWSSGDSSSDDSGEPLQQACTDDTDIVGYRRCPLRPPGPAGARPAFSRGRHGGSHLREPARRIHRHRLARRRDLHLPRCREPIPHARPVIAAIVIIVVVGLGGPPHDPRRHRPVPRLLRRRRGRARRPRPLLEPRRDDVDRHHRRAYDRGDRGLGHRRPRDRRRARRGRQRLARRRGRGRRPLDHVHVPNRVTSRARPATSSTRARRSSRPAFARRTGCPPSSTSARPPARASSIAAPGSLASTSASSRAPTATSATSRQGRWSRQPGMALHAEGGRRPVRRANEVDERLQLARHLRPARVVQVERLARSRLCFSSTATSSPARSAGAANWRNT